MIVDKSPHPQAKNSLLPSQPLSLAWQEIWKFELFKAEQSTRCIGVIAPFYLCKTEMFDFLLLQPRHVLAVQNERCSVVVQKLMMRILVCIQFIYIKGDI